MNKKHKSMNVRTITLTGLFGALSAVLMMISFNVPLMPSFIKMDFSELPALIAAFAMGPLSGAMVCLVKNLINVMFSTTGGVGEFSNFILGCAFVIPAGLIYKRNKSKRSALIGSLVGAVFMAVFSVFSNYFIVYPVYSMFMPIEAIIGMYHEIYPGMFKTKALSATDISDENIMAEGFSYILKYDTIFLYSFKRRKIWRLRLLQMGHVTLKWGF